MAFQYDAKARQAVDILSTSDDGDLAVKTIEFDAGDGLKCSGELIFPDCKAGRGLARVRGQGLGARRDSVFETPRCLDPP